MRYVGLSLGIIAVSQLLITSDVCAQALSGERKQALAVRVNTAIQVDGRLDEIAWQTAEPVVDFIQKEPVEGAEPTDRMEVRFIYDDTALYVGARMFASGPIRSMLSRRDDGAQVESIEIELDTFLDRRTAYSFGVTAAGVRLDHFHPTDTETNEDTEYDPVWQARTEFTVDGWTAELWLPFSQLRFNARDEHVWGLNIKRDVPSLDEENYWALIRRTETGWASRFGELHGLQGVTSGRRLEVVPYVAGSSSVNADRDLANPFDDGKNLSGRAGADLKFGLGSNLTLDVTANPDFGQIDADPAEVNLTAFETIFPELRPFFLEGNNVLTAGTGNYYYSRRIGARPKGSASGDFVNYPNTTTILGAGKLTGRLSSGTSIGLLGAVTDQEFAKTSTGGEEARVRVTPRSAWGVARVMQEIGDQGSVLGAHLTTLHREMSPTDALAARLSRNAVTGGADAKLRFGDRTYEADFAAGFTHIDGEPEAIAGYQRRNSHLFQRIDQPVIRFDGTRRSISGGQINGRINKVAGRHWLWRVNMQIESPEFEPSDFGRLNFAGDYSNSARVTYRETEPGSLFRRYSFTLNLHQSLYFDGNLGTRYKIDSNNSFTFLNFMRTDLNITRFFRGLDAQLTRGGPAMGVPLGWSYTWVLRNRETSRTRWGGSANYQSNELGDETLRINGGVSFRPSPSLQLAIRNEFRDENGTRGSFQGPINRQYLTTVDGGRLETYGQRYIFGVPDGVTISSQLRANYTFKPDLTLDVYAEPFAASGRYVRFGELLVPRGPELRYYGTDGTTIEPLADGKQLVTDGSSTFELRNYDFNVRSFRSNVVLRWEWRPGSSLFVVWQQNRASRVAEGQNVGFGDLLGSLSAAGDNIFAVKMTFWTSP